MAANQKRPDRICRGRFVIVALESAASVPLNISVSRFAEITNSDTITDKVHLRLQRDVREDCYSLIISVVHLPVHITLTVYKRRSCFVKLT